MTFIFSREAKEVFKDSVLPSAGQFKHLPALVAEYITLHNKEARRNALQSMNPLARSLYSTLDSHAGMEPAMTAPCSYQPQQADGLAHINNRGSLAFGLFDVGMSKHPALQGMQPPSNNHDMMLTGMGHANFTGQMEMPTSDQKQTTPGRHALRKGAPRKRRKLEFAAHEQQPLASPYGPERVHDANHEPQHPLDLPPELLNRCLNPESLEELLTDAEKQTRFAQGLAQIINQKKGMVPAQEDSQDGLFSDDLDWIQWLTAPEKSPGETKDGVQTQPQTNTGTIEVQPAENELPKDIERVDAGEQLNQQARTKPFQANPSVNLSEEIARYMQRPQDFEDLIEECIG